MNTAAMFGTVMHYGIGPFQAALVAAEKGTATAEQQQMLAAIIRASVAS